MTTTDTGAMIRVCELPAYANVREYYYVIPDATYVMSMAGRVPHVMKWHIDSDGYAQIVLRTRNRYQRTIRRSHLVLEAAGRPRPGPEYQADHLNSDQTDDRLENLEWVTPDQNTPRSGVRRSISSAHVALAREERKLGNTLFSTQDIAGYAGTTARTVQRAAAGRTHADVPDLPIPTGRQVRIVDMHTGEVEMSEFTDEEIAASWAEARRAKDHPEEYE